MPAEIVVPGDPQYHGTCITDNESRPDPSHCWSRAAVHIARLNEKGRLQFTFFERMEAAAKCAEMVEAILQLPRRPRRAPVKWGWGKGWPGIR